MFYTYLRKRRFVLTRAKAAVFVTCLYLFLIFITPYLIQPIIKERPDFIDLIVYLRISFVIYWINSLLYLFFWDKALVLWQLAKIIMKEESK